MASRHCPRDGGVRPLAAAAEAMFAEDFAGRILPFEAAAAVRYADIVLARRRVGNPIEGFDALIAATALATGASVATRDTRGFQDAASRSSIRGPHREGAGFHPHCRAAARMACIKPGAAPHVGVPDWPRIWGMSVQMRSFVFTLALLGIVTAAAHAEDAIPDIKGTWSGKGKSIVFGNNPHHPGAQTVTSPPRVRDFEFTFVVDGQDGRLAWGHSFSSVAATNEPFAWAISMDNKTIVGADTDGYYRMAVLAADRIEMCYNHAGLSPSGSIVATCYVMERAKP
jgi:hypothetical protein